MIQYKIVGISRFKSKQGNDCTVIHVVYENSRVIGLATDNMFIDEKTVNGELKPGAMCHIFFGRTGRVESIEIIEE